MNSKPLLLSAAILALLSACGGSGSDQTQPPPPPEQPQTSAPPPASTPPPPPEDKTPPPSSRDNTPETPLSPPPPPSPPVMKDVPDYAKKMTAADAEQATRDKLPLGGMSLGPEMETQIMDGNVAEARVEFLDVVLTDPAKMITPIEIFPYNNPPDKPAKWHNGSSVVSVVLNTPVPLGIDPEPLKAIKLESTVRSYEQYYSVLERIAGGKIQGEYGDGTVVESAIPLTRFSVAGKPTLASGLPAAGSATYLGYAMDHTDNTGLLSYGVDFGAKKGKGTISGLLPGKTIELQEAPVVSNHIAGNVTVDGANAYPDPAGGSDLTNIKYEAVFFGPQAEEIAGVIGEDLEEPIAGFAGQQQEFTP